MDPWTDNGDGYMEKVTSRHTVVGVRVQGLALAHCEEHGVEHSLVVGDEAHLRHARALLLVVVLVLRIISRLQFGIWRQKSIYILTQTKSQLVMGC